MRRRRAIALALGIAAGTAVLAGGAWALTRTPPPPIRVGVLHSFQGTMAGSEGPVAKATLMAIAEINAAGGVLGRKVEAVQADGASEPRTFAEQAERLISKERVATLFGCWTSASRKAVKTVVERHRNLLFYPVQYEGLESSPAIVYTGASPNQQIIPAVSWCLEHLGHRVFLVGSDYVFPRTAHEIIKDQLKARRATLAGEEYAPLGSSDFTAIAGKVAIARPDVVLSTVNGDSNRAFFAALRAAGLTSQAVPTLSFSVAENEVKRLSAEQMVGDYAAWNYFQSLRTPANARFVAAYRARYGSDAITDDPSEAGYFGVHLWAQAVRDAGVAEPQAIRTALASQSFDAPEGTVTLDGATQHTWKTVRVGRIRADGQFEIVWSSERPVRPVPYPIFRSRAAWDGYLAELSRGWGGAWAKPPL